jgi:type IV secretion system protein TrbF
MVNHQRHMESQMKESIAEFERDGAPEIQLPKPTASPRKATGTPAGNSYLAAKLEWNERYGDLISRAQNWRMVALVCAATSGVLALGLVMVSMRSRVVPYIVAVDSIGRAASQGPAEQARAADERLVRAAVVDWVEAVRTVTSDRQVQLHDIDKVFSMIGKGSPAQTLVTDYYKANSPFDRGANVTTSVEVHSVVASSDKTFDVEWTEVTRDLHGAVKETGNYRGSFTTVVNPPSDEQTIRLNPLGVYVTYISWSNVL